MDGQDLAQQRILEFIIDKIEREGSVHIERVNEFIMEHELSPGTEYLPITARVEYDPQEQRFYDLQGRFDLLIAKAKAAGTLDYDSSMYAGGEAPNLEFLR